MFLSTLKSFQTGCCWYFTFTPKVVNFKQDPAMAIIPTFCWSWRQHLTSLNWSESFGCPFCVLRSYNNIKRGSMILAVRKFWWSSVYQYFLLAWKELGYSMWRDKWAVLLKDNTRLHCSSMKGFWWSKGHWVDRKKVFKENITLIENIVKR